jgi:hypothetical protein
VNGDLITFIDGVEVARVANTDTFHNGTGLLTVGSPDNATLNHSQRNIDDVRITKGVGRYAASFTPPTRPHSSAQVIPTSGEFTLEGWARWETDPATAASVIASQWASVIASQWNEGENERGWQVYLNNNQLRFSYSTDGAVGTVVNTDKAWNPAADVWYHWAITRDASNNMRWFIDGVQIGTTASITATFHDSSAIVALGETEDHVTGSTQMYQAHFRATSGVARYVADFVPPTGPFASKPVDPRDFESLLIWLDGNDPASTFRDDGDNVFKILDKSGEARHLTQATASDGPNYVAAGSPLNGRNGWSFDNTEWIFRAAEAWMRPTRITVFAVHSPGTTSGVHFVGGVPYDGGTSWNSPWVGWQLGSLDNDQRFFLDTAGGLNNWTEIINFSVDVAQVQAMTWDGAVADTWHNGTAGTQQNLTDGDVQYGTPDPPFVLGARAEASGARGEFMSGDIGEYFAFGSAIGFDAIDILNNHLAAKWGI